MSTGLDETLNAMLVFVITIIHLKGKCMVQILFGFYGRTMTFSVRMNLALYAVDIETLWL